MSTIYNKKTPKRFVIADRDVIRDHRISSDAKNLYFIISSLAESCANVCPSHKWLAIEIGYNVYNSDGAEKSERAVHRFVSSKLAELTSIKAIKIIKNAGYTNDYEVYDYPANYPEQKCTGGMNKNVQGTPDKNVQGGLNKSVHIEIREEKEENKNKDIVKKINKKEKISTSISLEELKEINIHAIKEFKSKNTTGNEFKENLKNIRPSYKMTEFDPKLAKFVIDQVCDELINTMPNWDKKYLSKSPNATLRIMNKIQTKHKWNMGWSDPESFKSGYNNKPASNKVGVSYQHDVTNQFQEF